ncbi:MULTISPECIES: DUF1365 domain-containing protein [unclassified Lentimonas]|uniref:DUF1365 domain-containing protein n=1 Tax=unclassified Lentimonas TaxID=2630993 RepID=UPI00138A5463|nr:MULTISPECIES: DUF1365 domain-containing protein [unclassified Lentimonas]
MSWHSQIYRGQVVHQRMSPVEHAFSYPVTFFAFDLNELDTLAAEVRGFSHNQSDLLRLNDQDYLRGEARPIADQLKTYLGPELPGQHTRLVTSPRYFNYAFNPVNFHLRMQGDQLLAVVAEVNNTFGDRHVYPLNDLEAGDAPHMWTARCPKDFHVSPFNDLSGEYYFTFRIEAEALFLGVDLYREGACVLKTWIQGRGAAVTRASIWRYALMHPFDTALNSMPRIIWQAAQLYYKKKLQIYTRPSPESPQTLIDRDQHSEPNAVI